MIPFISPPQNVVKLTRNYDTHAKVIALFNGTRDANILTLPITQAVGFLGAILSFGNGVVNTMAFYSTGSTTRVSDIIDMSVNGLPHMFVPVTSLFGVNNLLGLRVDDPDSARLPTSLRFTVMYYTYPQVS